MATWKLVPDTGQISGGPHSSMPLVVIPSDIEIGAITLAEAQSVRYYTDSGLVTEVAREVVSSDELHFDGSSVSSSSEYWMDFDGVRSDYAVTDTYGRNAVWSSGYYSVHHMQSTSYIDSTGNGHDGTNNGTTIVSGELGNAGNFTKASADNVDTNDNYADGGDGVTSLKVSAWVKPATLASGFYSIATKSNGVTPRSWVLRTGGNGSGHRVVAQQFTSAGSSIVVVPAAYDAITSTTGFTFIGQRWTGTRLAIMVNGVEGDSASISSIETSSALVVIGAYGNLANAWDGDIDEVRIEQDRSDDWWTTEYNNQNDNAAFWVATDVSGGGGGGWVGYPMIHMLQFNCVM